MDDKHLVDTLHAATKYKLAGLADAAVDRLRKWVNRENALEVHEKTAQLNQSRLQAHLTEIVQLNAKQLVSADAFDRVARTTVEFLLEQPRLQLTEAELFAGCVRWARAELSRRRIEKPNPAQLREALGDLVYKLRLPAMSVDELLKGPARSGLFKLREVADLLFYISLDEHPRNGVVSRFRSFEARLELRPVGIPLTMQVSQRRFEYFQSGKKTMFIQSGSAFQLHGLQLHSDHNVTVKNLYITVDSVQLHSQYKISIPPASENRRDVHFERPVSVAPGSLLEISMNAVSEGYWHCHYPFEPSDIAFDTASVAIGSRVKLLEATIRTDGFCDQFRVAKLYLL